MWCVYVYIYIHTHTHTHTHTRLRTQNIFLHNKYFSLITSTFKFLMATKEVQWIWLKPNFFQTIPTIVIIQKRCQVFNFEFLWLTIAWFVLQAKFSFSFVNHAWHTAFKWSISIGFVCCCLCLAQLEKEQHAVLYLSCLQYFWPPQPDVNDHWIQNTQN